MVFFYLCSVLVTSCFFMFLMSTYQVGTLVCFVRYDLLVLRRTWIWQFLAISLLIFSFLFGFSTRVRDLKDCLQCAWAKLKQDMKCGSVFDMTYFVDSLASTYPRHQYASIYFQKHLQINLLIIDEVLYIQVQMTVSPQRVTEVGSVIFIEHLLLLLRGKVTSILPVGSGAFVSCVLTG